MIKTEEGRFVNILYPENFTSIILDAPHATKPSSDLYTGEIVRKAVEIGNVAGIISKISREKADLNRDENHPAECQKEAISEHYKSIKKILKKFHLLDEQDYVTRQVLFLGIHGFKDQKAREYNADILIGTCNLKTCSKHIRDWVKNELQKQLKARNIYSEIALEVPEYCGDQSLIKLKETFGKKFNVIQIELSKNLRKNYRNEIASILGNLENLV